MLPDSRPLSRCNGAKRCEISATCTLVLRNRIQYSRTHQERNGAMRTSADCVAAIAVLTAIARMYAGRIRSEWQLAPYLNETSWQIRAAPLVSADSSAQSAQNSAPMPGQPLNRYSSGVAPANHVILLLSAISLSSSSVAKRREAGCGHSLKTRAGLTQPIVQKRSKCDRMITS
jgi:hypothetical protein